MINIEFKSIIEIINAFPDEQTCIDQLEELRWDGNVVSPFNPESTVYKCKDNKYRCKDTGKYFNVKTNSIFDNTKIGLQKWFLAIWLVTSHKKGISSIQLGKDIDVTQKTAWFMLQRIRQCFGDENDGQLEKTVEIDETFVGGKNKNRHWDKKVEKCQGRSFKDKTPVLGMLQRGRKVIAKIVKDTSVNSLLPKIMQYVKQRSTLYTDEWNYGNVSEMYYHDYVHHGAKIYGHGDVYTNTIEGFWSICKRSIIGIYHIISRKHMQLYFDEYAFRYNTIGYSECSRFKLLLKNMENRITYKQLVYGKY